MTNLYTYSKTIFLEKNTASSYPRTKCCEIPETADRRRTANIIHTFSAISFTKTLIKITIIMNTSKLQDIEKWLDAGLLSTNSRKNIKKATKSDDNVKNKNSAAILDHFSLLRQVSRGWRSSVDE
jgi:hypothetical protein